MDHFFCSVSSLMSLNLHSAVYASIDDLVQFIEMYKLGNDFTGHFERCLPVLPQPITLTVVRHHFMSFSVRNRNDLETLQWKFVSAIIYVETWTDSSWGFLWAIF